MISIQSKDNIKIKDLVKLRDDSKFRNDKSLFYIEGERLFLDTPKSLVNEIYVKASKFEYFKSYLNAYSDNNIYILDDNVYNKVSDTLNSQGIIATVKYNLIENIDIDFLSKISNAIILDSINDPGNLGTIIRLAEASNVSLIILANNCCSIYNPKTIRASMSSIFREKIYISDNIINTIQKLKQSKFTIYSTSLNDKSNIYNSFDYKNKSVFVFGNEANGVSNDIISISDETLFIPMCGSIESLNVSISASIILYEVMRQNNYYEN